MNAALPTPKEFYNVSTLLEFIYQLYFVSAVASMILCVTKYGTYYIKFSNFCIHF